MLLATKLHIPPLRPTLVARPRLFSKLQQGLGSRLILVSAPAGFGKTTLLSAWLAAGSRPAGWISLDAGDNDPVRFLAYLVAGLESAVPGCTGATGEVLGSSKPPPIETILTILVNELCTLPGPTVLVLDDYHVIDTPAIHEAITFLVDHGPPNVCLVVATRADPPFPAARWRSCGQLLDLGSDDLRFTAEETALFVNEMMALDLDADDLATLEARTEGWIAGLQMAALSMQDRADRSQFVRSFSGSHRYILDYLLEEVLDRQSPDVQRFLLQTSILERLCAPLCDAVTGRPDSQPLLEQLERSNLFLVPLDDERQWYRYHRLFSDFLANSLARSEEIEPTILHSRASEWFDSHNLVSEAINHAFASGRLDYAADLVERHAMSAVIRSELVTLSRWLERLPREIVRQRPWLCVYQAWIRYWVGPREDAEEWLHAAERATSARPLPSGDDEHEPDWNRLGGHIAAIRAYRALENEEIQRGMELARESLALLPETEFIRYAGAIALGIAHWARGEVEATKDAFLQARSAAHKSGNRSVAAAATCYVGIQETRQGRLHQAASTYRQSLSLAVGSDGRQLLAAGYPLVKLADLYREWNDLEAAEEHLARGLRLCQRWGHADALAEGYIARARLCLAQQDLPGMHKALTKTEQLVRDVGVDPWLGCWLDDCRIRYWLARGDLEAAIRWSRSSGPPLEADLSFLRDLDHINLARVLVAWGASESSLDILSRARRLLDRLVSAATSAGWIHETIRILLLQALVHQGRDESTQALASLEYALALAEPGGYVRTFTDEGPAIQGLLGKALAQQVAPDYVERLLAAFGTESVLSPAIQAGLVEPLTGREQEILQLLAAGLSNREIAAQLFLAVGTVKTHVHNIYGKLDARSRAHAIARARELRLI
jgi:LuxR family maltose regulon positive regulatory protein